MTTQEAKQQLAQSVSTQELDKLMTQLEQYCIKLKIPYSKEQLYEAMALFDKLCNVATKPQAMLILDNLMFIAYRSDLNQHWDWVCQELDFERLVYSVGGRGTDFTNHRRMAQAALDVRPIGEMDDDVLDNYNERISRYEKYPDVYPCYSPS